MSTSQKQASFFVSLADHEKQLVEDLLGRLEPHLKASINHVYRLWAYQRNLLVGLGFKKQIIDAIESCEFGLLMLSPTHLTRPFVIKEELPLYVPTGDKPILPIALKRLDFKRHNLRGLQDYQVFRLDGDKAYSECTTEADKERFAYELFVAIEERLESELC